MVTDERLGLLVEPKDVHSLEIALQLLLEDPGRCQSIGHAARAQAEKFSWNRNVQSHLEILGRTT
jgi:glycosyltransferase involved in cell wall biosynthesis